MPATQPCVPCCPTPQSVNIPGVEGIPGTDGVNGTNAFTTLTGNDYAITAIGVNYILPVVDSTWMVPGQIIVFGGPATFLVVSKPDDTSVIATFLGYPGDLSVNFVIPSGTTVSPGGVMSVIPTPLSVDAVGTAYSLTTSVAKLTFGTTSPVLTITAPGTYLLIAHVKYNFVNATFATSRLVTTKIRRTNNTAGDVVTNLWMTGVTAGLTALASDLVLTPTLYTTANSNDSIELQGGVATSDGTPGTLDAVVASIVAIKLF